MFRNLELRRELLVLTVSSLFFTFFMWYKWGLSCGLPVGIFLMGILLFYGWRGKVRYKTIAALGEEIDRILHGEEQHVMEHCEEGDMAVLSVQISKMIRRLKEQQSILQKEKISLANAMADISHQMKTPLTSVQLLLNFMQEEHLQEEKRMEYVQRIRMLTERIDWMVYALLRMAKLDAGVITLQMEKIEVNMLLKKAYDSLAIAMELREIQFSMTVQDNLFVRGDSSWLLEAITNIYKNCMEHTPKDGMLSVEATQTPLYVQICVKDTGTGIDEKDLPHIFERFYRGNHQDDENHVGIGLALAKQIVVAHNGTIKACNNLQGEGASFILRFYKSTV